MEIPHRRLQGQVILLAFIRTILNTANRMVYPFLAVFARGMGVSLGSISLAITARSFVAALNPLLAPVAEGRGRKAGLMLAVGLITLANATMFIWPVFPVFVAAQCFSFLGLYFFFSTAHAFVGDNVPYAVRGRSSALIEFSWSLSFIIGVPLVGLLISRYGWRAPFPLFALLGLVCLLLLARFIPRGKPRDVSAGSFRAGLACVLRSPSALFGLLFSVLFHIGNESVNLVFGVWMEDSFGLKIAALGAVSLVIGIADLMGEGLSAAWVDRLGKKRSIAIGLLVNALASLVLLGFGKSLPGALVGLFFSYLSFELVVVCFLPVMSEVLPSARATLLAYDVAAHALGRALGALLAPILYAGGFHFNALAAAIFSLVSLLALRGIKVKTEELRSSQVESR